MAESAHGCGELTPLTPNPRPQTHRPLDTKHPTLHSVPMKITVTLDDDLLQTIRNAMYRSGRSFREVLNDALRTGLRATVPAAKRTPFVVLHDATHRGVLHNEQFCRLGDCICIVD